MDAGEEQPKPGIAFPDTIKVSTEVFTPRIILRQHGWPVWATIAIEHENSARRARETHLTTEHLSGLVAIAAAAFALDALYGVARNLIPVPEVDAAEARGEEGGRKRARHVAERLRRGVSPGRLAESWPTRIRELYKTRDDAVHFGESDSDPVWHPGLESNVSPETFAWRLEAAEASVDLMLEVLTRWAENPSENVRSWANTYGPSVASLLDARGRGT